MKIGDLVRVVDKESMFYGLEGFIIDRKTSRGVLNIPSGSIPVRLNNDVIFYFYPDQIIRVPSRAAKTDMGSFDAWRKKHEHLIKPRTSQAFKFRLLSSGDRSVGIPSVDEEVIVIFKGGGWNYPDTEKWLHETFAEFVDGGHCIKE